MPVIAAPRLRAIGEALLVAAGAPAAEDATWARLVTSAQGYGLAQELSLG